MTKLILKIVPLFISLYINSQNKNSFDNYYNDLEVVDTLIQNKEYNKAINLLRKAENFAKEHPFMYSYGYQNLQIASLQIKLGKIKEAEEELKKAIIYGETDIFNYKYLFNDSVVAILEPKIKPIYNDLVRIRFCKLKNIDAYLETQRLLELDQIIRVNVSEFKYKGIYSTNKEFGLIEAMDSIVTVRCISLVKKHGWNIDLEQIAWHHRDFRDDDTFWIKLKPYFEEEIKKGNLPTSFFAKYEDYASFEKTGFTIYGTIPGKVNPETVNIMRKKVHLSPLSKKRIEFINSQW
jgi:tetratricopeptide (TPR) repeat protein